MKLLVIGFGLIGGQRVQALTNIPTVSEIFVYDPRLTEGAILSPKAKAVSESFAFANRYHAAVVATPHDTTVELVPRVLPLTPSVLVEKPLGRTSAETESLIAAAERSDSRIFVGLNYRFLKNIQRLRGLLSSGNYGRVLGVDAVLSHGAQPGYEKSWKTDAVRCGGGVCIDPGIHLFDLLQWLFGGAELVAGHLTRQFWEIQVEDHASLVLTLPGGALASLSLSLASWQSRLEITVETEQAQFLLRGRGKFYGSQHLTIVSRWPWLHPQEPRETRFDFGIEDTSLQEETEEFVAASSGMKKDLAIATSADALRSMRVVDACYSKLVGSEIKKHEAKRKSEAKRN